MAAILPRSSNCVPIIPEFRQNLGQLTGGVSVPLRLDFLYPLLFPKSDLVGHNHSAFPDALQLRDMALLYCEPTKPFASQSQSAGECIARRNPNQIRHWSLEEGLYVLDRTCG